MSLPKALNYGNGAQVKTNAVASVSSVYTCTPSNSASAYTPGTLLSFDIPTGIRSQWMDPTQTFLKFTVTAALVGGTAPTWGALPWDFIRTASLYSSAGSKQIESLDQYSALHTLLRDLGSDADNARCSDSITFNSSDTGVLRASNFQNTGSSFTYVMPLASIIGLSSADDLYLPLHALNAPLRFEVLLHSADQALQTTGAPTAVAYQITNPSINVGLCTISDVAMSQIANMTNGVYNWSSTLWRNYRQVSAANQTINSIMIPCRFSSLRAILVALRPTASPENRLANSVSDRVKNYLQSWQFKIGSSYANAKPIDCSGNAVSAYMEFKRVMAGLTSESLPTMIERAAWVKDVATVPAANTAPGAFVVSLEAQPFSNIQNLLSGVLKIICCIQQVVHMCDNFTLCVRSKDRTAGNASDYSVKIPALPKGLYKATFRMSADNTIVQEVRVRWGITNAFDTSSLGYVSALTCTYDGEGQLYTTDPPSSMDVQVYDAGTGALYDSEHQILIHLEKQQMHSF
jgi:hypothetical protein